MATVISEPEATLVETESTTTPQPEPNFPDATHLENRMPEWFRAPRSLAGFILVLGLLFCSFSYRPLWHTDVWGHLAYGRLISETGEIPEYEPFMPLSEGVPMVDTAWLSQVVGYGVFSMFGVTAIQFLYAASVTVCLALLCGRCYRRTGNFTICLLGCGLFLWVEWESFFVPRPQLAGLVIFTILFTVMTSRKWFRANWFLVPLLFALWANLHGSFPAGLVMLGAFCVGRAIDVGRRCSGFSLAKRSRAITRDTFVRRSFLLLELSAAAALLNPYGLGLYVEIFQFSAHPNLAILTEWEPLTLRMNQGQAAACLAMLLIFLYRYTPRRVQAVEPILLIGFGAATLWISRMLLWWGPVAMYFAVLHGNAIYRHRFCKTREPQPSPSNSLWAVVSIGMVWIAFASNPFGFRLLHGAKDDTHRSYSGQTPIGAVEFLQKYPPEGQIFNTYESGDYLVWNGPENLQVFVTSHAHLVPTEVWQHYLHIIRLETGWDNLLDRYGVNTIVLNSWLNDDLTAKLKTEPSWEMVYEDNNSIVFVRRNPI
jgi:hypothetical protein